jgi:hypothetical protein
VLGAFGAVPWAGTTIIDWKDAYKHADAIAIAPYFGNKFGDPKTADQVVQMSIEQLLVGCRDTIRENRKNTQQYAAEAHKRGLQLVAYEGGQHLVGYSGAENNDRLTRLFFAANRDPEMKDVYLEDLNAWKESGGELFCLFSSMTKPTKWGSWGILESEGQKVETSPKYQAVQEFLRKNPIPSRN